VRRAVNVRSAPMFSAFCKASAMILAFSRLVSFVDFFSRQPSAVAKQAYQMGERLRESLTTIALIQNDIQNIRQLPAMLVHVFFREEKTWLPC
jgi:hypothetical protein